MGWQVFGPRRGRVAAVTLVSLLLGARAAQAQSARSSGEGELGRVVAAAVDSFAHALRDGHAAFFRLIENVEILRIESEIDRFVGDPRMLNDATSYKLSLLPFHIQYPIYKPLVAQMVRLDSVRSRPIHMVTPDSVSLIDLRIPPVLTLDAFRGEGMGGQVQESLLTHFSAREMADLSVFLLSQQVFFPETDEGWARVKHRVARMALPLTAGALATGAAFDAGALAHSGRIVGKRDDLRLRWYAGFRDLGVHLHPEVRGGLALHAFGFQAAAGIADRVNPAVSQPDRALELALREGWLNVLGQRLGLDAFVEAAVRRALVEPAGYVGPHTAMRAGFFFRRDQIPGLPSLALRGSTEFEGGPFEHAHPVLALGVEQPSSGLTTMAQASRLPAAPEFGLVTEDRLSVFLAGAMEPLSAMFAEDMMGLARRCQIEWDELLEIDRRREAWERLLLTRGTAHRAPEEVLGTLRQMERLLIERDEHQLRLAATLADYLESRRRAYGVLGWKRAPDELHGPLSAVVLVGARDGIFTRLRGIAAELEDAVAPLATLRARIAAAQRESARLESSGAAAPALNAQRRAVVELEQQWDREAERVRRQLATREELWAEGKRVLRALGRHDRELQAWQSLGFPTRRRLAWMTSSTAP